MPEVEKRDHRVVNTRSEEIQLTTSTEVYELVNSRPHWIIRRGSAIFFLIFLFLIFLSWLIQYPDAIKGPLTLVAVQAPVLLTAKTAGKLEKILVTNEQNVKTGTYLAYLQSTADHEQVLTLHKWILNIEPYILNDDFNVLVNNNLPILVQLGELQQPYQEFQNMVKETLQILPNGYYQHQRMNLEQDLNFLSTLKQNIKQQEELQKAGYDLQQHEYNVNKKLADQKVIAQLELNQNKSKLLTREQGIQLIKSQEIDNSIAAHNKEKELLELKKITIDKQQAFRSRLFNLKSLIEQWIQQYIVVASETGKVLFIGFFQENQLLNQGQELFYIQPHQSKYYGQLRIGQAGLGKVETGQKVLIKVNSYPSNEYGYLTGKVSYISNIPVSSDSFLIRVELPDGLQTNYNKTIFFRNNLLAEASVITSNKRLIHNFIGKLNEMITR